LQIAIRVFWFIAALGLLVWLLDGIGWSTMGRAFVQVGWLGALSLLFVGSFEDLFDTAALRATVQRRVGLFRLLTYQAAGSLLNTVIPWEAGEVLKGTLLRRHLSTHDAVRGTVLWNYLFKLSRPAMTLLAALCGLVLGHAIDNRTAAVLLGACLIAFLPYLALKLLIHQGLAGMTVRLLRGLRLLRRDPEGWARAAQEMDREIRSFRRDYPADYARVLIYQSCGRLVSFVTWGLAFRLLGLDYSLGTIALINAAISVASYVAMLVPARIGVAEGSYYVAFALLGLQAAIGLIAAVLMRLKALVTTGILALFAVAERKPVTAENSKAGDERLA
jgi:hypothetical protein